jgi:hypothetical protein
MSKIKVDMIDAVGDKVRAVATTHGGGFFSDNVNSDDCITRNSLLCSMCLVSRGEGSIFIGFILKKPDHHVVSGKYRVKI